MEAITSRKNPLVLLMRRVAQGDADERGRMLLDGLHLVQEARAAGLSLSTAAFSTKVLAAPDGLARRLATTLAGLGCRVAQVSDQVMEAMSPVSSPSGVVALANRPKYELSDVLPSGTAERHSLPLDAPFAEIGASSLFSGPADMRGAATAATRPPALLCVAVDVQDPGNLGAIVRVAEAGGAAGVIVAGAGADPYGWKALRGAMGSAFRLPIVREVEAMTVVEALKRAGVRVLATAPGGRESFADQPLTGACACLLGGEGPGLSADLIAAADGIITIPMQPPVESLNVAVSAALIVYEARRQRLAQGRNHELTRTVR